MIVTCKLREDDESWKSRLSSDKSSGSQSVVPRPAAPASPGKFPEKHILRLHFRSTDSEAPGWSPAIGLNEPTGDCDAG